MLSVSVNVSGRQLAEAGFLADVAQALADSDLPPAALTVEMECVKVAGQVLGLLIKLR